MIISNMNADLMQLLVHAIQELSCARTVLEIAGIVRRTARTLTGADGATFVLRDGAQCYYMDEDAIAPLWKGKRFPAEHCISGWSMRQRQVVVIEDIYKDARIPHDAYRPTFVRSLVMVPIRADDPLGAIGNYWAQSHTATVDEIELLRALADSTAIAMENAYLHASMQQQVEERTRELQLAREQADKANMAKSRFLAAASHNLRQPIQTLSAVGAILDRVRDEQEARVHLQSMGQAIRNMQSMLDTLLDLHQLEAGTLTPHREDTPLEGVLARLRSEFAYIANAKPLRLDIPQQVPAVHTDPYLLQEILRNLLSNAIKYTASGAVRLECRTEEELVRIVVADTGVGIPEDYLGRIFEAFYRAPHATAAGTEGLGLGLSIVEQLARILDHRIEVESSAGVGSRFSVLVPRARQQPQAAPAPQPIRHSAATLPARILYVEDHPTVRQSITTLLSIEGYVVTAVSSGAEAQRAVLEQGCQPQLVISDFHLPAGETGEQVIARVVQALGRRIPALLLTGRARDNRTASSVHRVLHKPVDANLLLAEIAMLLNTRVDTASAA